METQSKNWSSEHSQQNQSPQIKKTNKSAWNCPSLSKQRLGFAPEAQQSTRTRTETFPYELFIAPVNFSLQANELFIAPSKIIPIGWRHPQETKDWPILAASQMADEIRKHSRSAALHLLRGSASIAWEKEQTDTTSEQWRFLRPKPRQKGERLRIWHVGTD